MLRRIAALLLAATPLAAQGPRTGMIVSTEWLAENQKRPEVVLIHVGSRDSVYRAQHIAGARFLRYNWMVQDVNGVFSELPSVDSLRALFEGLGVSDASHVVLTGQNLVVTRAYYTLDYLGHPRVSILDGGLTKWRQEGRPTAEGEGAVTQQARGRLTPRAASAHVVATTDWVKGKVGKPGVAFLDTRTEEEYLGTRSSTGHIEGARILEWRDFFTDPYEFALKDQMSLMRIFMQRVQAPTDTVVAYCAVGYRASGTYFVAKLLGLPVKLYDGSYDAWNKAGLPVTKTPTPLIAPRAPQKIGGGLPFVSPDGKRIAFTANREGNAGDVYVIDAGGANEKRLTNTPEYEGAPAWIGHRVLAYSGQDTATVVAVDPVSGTQTQVLRAPGREFRVSPDGKALLYTHGPFLQANLSVAALDGSARKSVSQGMPAKFNAAWSPDGKRIAYAVMDSTRQLQVGVMNADGTNARTLTSFVAEQGSPQWPSWSPDGRTLAIQVGKYERSNPAANTAHIWTVDVATGRATRLGWHERPYLDETPSWFPDGKRIAFQSDRTGVMQVWVMNADGSEARQLTRWTP